MLVTRAWANADDRGASAGCPWQHRRWGGLTRDDRERYAQEPGSVAGAWATGWRWGDVGKQSVVTPALGAA